MCNPAFEASVKLKAAWVSKSEHTASEHIIYNLLRGKDAKRGFNQRLTSIQGNDPWYAFNLAKRSAWHIANANADFEKRFGIARPEYLLERIRNA